MASNTTNLGLLKKDPIADGNDTFNIDTMLNENWDKLDGAVGDMATVPTTAKDAAGAITELFTNVSNGKLVVAAAITDMGVPASGSDTFGQLADKIGDISTGTDTSDATAVAADLLNGKTAYGPIGKINGSMPNNGAPVYTPGKSDQTIPKGYTNGSGKVLAVPVPAAKVLSDTTIAGTVGTMVKQGGWTQGASVLAAAGRLHMMIPPGGYLENASGQVNPGVYFDDPDFIAGNIRNGINMFGLDGALKEKKVVTGSVTSSLVSSIFNTLNGTFSYYYVEITGHNLDVYSIVLTPPGSPRRIVYIKDAGFNGGAGADTILNQVNDSALNRYILTTGLLVITPTLIRLPVLNSGSAHDFTIVGT
ncbi:MAG: hypothetical protein ACE3L7_07155 [Candidatus Pristimantibacillus sp.]